MTLAKAFKYKLLTEDLTIASDSRDNIHDQANIVHYKCLRSSHFLLIDRPIRKI